MKERPREIRREIRWKMKRVHNERVVWLVGVKRPAEIVEQRESEKRCARTEGGGVKRRRGDNRNRLEGRTKGRVVFLSLFLYTGFWRKIKSISEKEKEGEE